MSRINVLQAEVFNKIAAGEVVEKPASIVKELVENSLDAKSTEITIEIMGGGIDKIKVVDNGTGIHPDDVKTAFLPHSTSKIKEIEDLYNISTLGFRGEALASIASVSKVCLETKQENFELGKQLKIDGGIVKDFCDIGKNNGTSIEVSELFYNIPARKKFLRKPKTEESEITNLVARYILANPTIKFTYIVDKSIVYKTNGTTLEDAIFVVYKINSEENLIKVDFKQDNIEISGYISKPTFTKPNRTYQTLLINKRYVVNNLISTCIQNAYENFLMKKEFPLFVLNFNLPNDFLDVNVHPNKLDVKFENTQKVYGYFYSAISKALLSFQEIKQVDNSFLNKNNFDFKTIEKPNFVGKSFSNFVENKSIEENANKIKNEENKTENENENIINSTISSKIYETQKENLDIKTKIFNEYASFAGSNTSFGDSPALSRILEKELNENSVKIEEVNIISNKQENVEKYEIVNTKAQVFENINLSNYKILGTLFNTYILIEMEDSLLLLDQHACHERLNYDKLIKQIEEKQLTMQPLLIPYIFDTNSLETDFILNNLTYLNELGFSISLFGDNTFKVSTIPSVLYDINLAEFFKDLLNDLNSFKKLQTIDLLKEKLSQKACKASVKAGNKLSNSDIEILLNKMEKSNMTLACPHGRPAIIEITKTEIEKFFKRKV